MERGHLEEDIDILQKEIKFFFFFWNGVEEDKRDIRGRSRKEEKKEYQREKEV